MYNYVKVAAAVPNLEVANCYFNQESICAKIMEARHLGIEVLVFPELCITGYTCGDLFFQQTLQKATLDALQRILSATESIDMLVAVGAPLCIDNQLFNCAIVLSKGKIVGIVPKTYIPNYNEFYEQRWFSSAFDLKINTINICSQVIPIGTDLLFSLHNGTKIGVEICEDLWVPIPPSAGLCVSGADIILNLSASNETVAKRQYRRNLVVQQSARCMCAYVYASAGGTESTTDLVFSGHSMIAENGVLLKENTQLIDSDYLLSSHVDIDKLRVDRCKYTTYKETHRAYFKEIRCIPSDVQSKHNVSLDYPISRKPFVPSNLHLRDNRCQEIVAMQVAGLVKRLVHTNAPTVVIGISGGLDSTLALLVCVQAFDELKKDRKGILAVTMPGFGTTNRTYNNALTLIQELGVTRRVIDIKKSCYQHFEDIEHDETIHDITYENTQARERTKLLMNLANKHKGFVIGTGDLSELALGWCTYNGDHMSMYAVNVSIPKTLIRSLVLNIAHTQEEKIKQVLLDILDTPVSPELLPIGKNGEMIQKTEDSVGPYELHDFFLFYVMRYGFSPSKILFLAKHIFSKKETEEDVLFDDETIQKWLIVFYKRFFSQQFKRNCMPDGPKVGSICLSPRGDWRMPSDAVAHEWLKEISGNL